jgi:hypothetical protein
MFKFMSDELHMYIYMLQGFYDIYIHYDYPLLGITDIQYVSVVV